MKRIQVNTTRRGVLGGLLAAAAAAVAGAPAAQTGPAKRRRRWGMSIDLNLCTGCGGCVVACRAENNVALTGHGPDAVGTDINWMELLPKPGAADVTDAGTPPALPMPCMHCENPPCVKVCPVNATYQDDEGLVNQVWDRCIGCRYCEVACPYSRRYFNWKHAEIPESYLNLLNPDVAPRPEGVVEKCTFCHHRIRRADEDARREGRELEDTELRRLPACAQSCPAGAIVFGDLNDPSSRVSRDAASPRSSRLLEHLGTEPKVFYLAKDVQE
jgi:molybdopterin-containing oxidoreductase family iron-sulfur binding subunit